MVRRRSQGLEEDESELNERELDQQHEDDEEETEQPQMEETEQQQIVVVADGEAEELDEAEVFARAEKKAVDSGAVAKVKQKEQNVNEPSKVVISEVLAERREDIHERRGNNGTTKGY